MHLLTDGDRDGGDGDSARVVDDGDGAGGDGDPEVDGDDVVADNGRERPCQCS